MSTDTDTDASLIRQGLEQQLQSLEELRFDFIGESEVPEICATCYIAKDECYCDSPVYWPLPAVIYKLRAELRSEP